MPWEGQDGASVMLPTDTMFPTYDMIGRGIGIGTDPLPPPGLKGGAYQDMVHASLPWWMAPVAAALGVAGRGGKPRFMSEGPNHPPPPLSSLLRRTEHPAPDRPVTVQNARAMLEDLGLEVRNVRHTGESTYIHFVDPRAPRVTKDPVTGFIHEGGQGTMFAPATSRIRIAEDGHAAHPPSIGEQGVIFDTAWRAGARYDVDPRHAMDAQGRHYANIDVLREELTRRFRPERHGQPPAATADPSQPELAIPAQRQLLAVGGAAAAAAAGIGSDFPDLASHAPGVTDVPMTPPPAAAPAITYGGDDGLTPIYSDQLEPAASEPPRAEWPDLSPLAPGVTTVPKQPTPPAYDRPAGERLLDAFRFGLGDRSDLPERLRQPGALERIFQGSGSDAVH